MSCKWDRETEAYLNDGEPCKVDDYGDPTYHCTARRTCSVHVGPHDLTCARCVGRTRALLRHIPTLATLVVPIAVTAGVDSEAANMAGPAADPARWSDRRVAMRSHLATWERFGRISEQQHLHARALMEDDDEHHPLTVLGRWALMIAEDYGHELPTLTITNAADYLGRTLTRIANDDEQDFPLLARELRKCHQHLELVVALAVRPERGAPCPDCTSEGTGVPRLVREYAHWCEADDCERMHYADDSEDRWVCPRDRSHTRTVDEYSNYLTERRGA